MNIKKVAVIGAGTMGSSIAMALACKGFTVLLKDIEEDCLRQALKRIDRFFESAVRKGLPADEAAGQKRLITTTIDYTAFQDIDLVIEAVAEDIEIKRAVFQELDRACDAGTIFATNTSSLPVSRIASCTSRPDKVVGMHFFNPAHLMKLVEVIPGLLTAPETVSCAMQFAQNLGKLAVRVEECPSFLVNRLLGRYMNEALWCLQENPAGVEEIDQAACDMVMPIGPLALRDMNGADIGLAVARFNFTEYGERFRPAPLLEKMVEKNLLGQKTGEGFYLYGGEPQKRTARNPKIAELVESISGGTAFKLRNSFDVKRIFLPMINEAFLALQEKVCSTEDLDPALTAGLGMRKGPLAMAEDLGLSNCLAMLETLFAQHGERFRPAYLLKRYVWAGKTTIL